MNQDDVVTLMRGLLWMATAISGPLLVAGLVVGVVMGVVQAATQIQEASLSFVPKLAAMGLALVLGGPWAVQKLVTFTGHMLEQVALVAPRGRG